MTEQKDYRLYLNSEFGRIHEKLDAIKMQTTKTNDRVSHLEEKTNHMELTMREHPLICERTKEIDEIKSDLEEYRFLKRYPKVMLFIIALLVAGVIVGAIGAINSVGVKENNKELKRDMDGIRYYLSPVKSATSDTIE